MSVFIWIFLFLCAMLVCFLFFFFFSSRRRHTRCLSDWSSDVCSSDLTALSAPVCLFFTVTTASEMIAFAGSVTEPCKAPVGVWADAATTRAINKESGKKILTERFIWFLLDCEERILRCEERKRAVEFPPSIPCKLFEPSASPQISVWKKSSPTALSIRGLFIQLSIRWRIKRTGNGIDGTRGIIGNVAINRKPIKSPAAITGGRAS